MDSNDKKRRGSKVQRDRRNDYLDLIMMTCYITVTIIIKITTNMTLIV